MAAKANAKVHIQNILLTEMLQTTSYVIRALIYVSILSESSAVLITLNVNIFIGYTFLWF